MNKSFGLVKFQEVLLLSSIKHFFKCRQTNPDLAQDYQLAKLSNSLILDYFSSP